jgi:hypothetical protein
MTPMTPDDKDKSYKTMWTGTAVNKSKKNMIFQQWIGIKNDDGPQH